jgi:urea carboxylase
MEGPGGYQFVGRTVQMWNTFARGIPWLLRFFDQIRFYPVSAAELLEIREVFPHGGYRLKIDEEQFRIRDYHAFLRSISREVDAFKRRQQAAFDAERERWAKNPWIPPPESDLAPPVSGGLPEGCRAVAAPVTASVWNIAVSPGQRVEVGQKLLILEAMKMEIAVAAPAAGVVEQLDCAPGALVSAGQRLVTLRT